MIIEELNGILVLIPDQDKLLTNGDVISDKVFLGINDDKNNWMEIEEKSIPELEDISQEEALDIILGGSFR